MRPRLLSKAHPALPLGAAVSAMDDFRDEVASRVFAAIAGGVHGGAALLAANDDNRGDYGWPDMASHAYDAADAFLKERTERLKAGR